MKKPTFPILPEGYEYPYEVKNRLYRRDDDLNVKTLDLENVTCSGLISRLKRLQTMVNKKFKGCSPKLDFHMDSASDMFFVVHRWETLDEWQARINEAEQAVHRGIRERILIHESGQAFRARMANLRATLETKYVEESVPESARTDTIPVDSD